MNTLREGIESQGNWRFNLWTYGTHDVLAEVLEPGYFTRARWSVRVGDMILVGTEPQRMGPIDPPVGESRRALLMVTVNDMKGVQTRLVLDFGGPYDAGPAPMALTPPTGEPNDPMAPLPGQHRIR
jgi:hypothetical protein